jgi:hypothetical protein
MKNKSAIQILCLLLNGGLGVTAAHADPMLTSWFTANSGQYAHVYTSTANRTAGITATTWSGQTLPTYAGVHEIDYSTNWIYIRNTGLASYVMGPWSNPNWPKNQGTSTSVYRFPRGNVGVTNVAAAKTLTGLGAIGHLVDGVAIYNDSDGFSYSYSHSEDASPMAGIGNGDGIWNRDALPNEGVSFDYALNHPQQQGEYHSHANPIAIRYLLGDNVNYDGTTKNYSEDTNTTVFRHSPILGWLNDGLPLYGPYGYSDPTNPASPVRRMISGYVLRNGQYGTTNLGATGRTTLPAWAALAQNRSMILSAAQYGPNTNATYPPGHYMEDYDYLGDHGYVQGVTNADGTFFDLNQYNARWCVTPEYPNGTWAYFESILTNGTSYYPYHTGRWYLDNPTGGASTTTVMNADTPLTLYFKGATNLQEVLNSPAVDSGSGNVTLTWSAVQGGSYQVANSTDLSNWSTTATTITATNNSATATEAGDAATSPQKFYRVVRTGVATFDSAGY